MSGFIRIFFLGFFLLNLTSCSVTRQKKVYMKKTLKAIEETFPEAQVSMLNDSIKVLFPNNVLFDKGSTNLGDGFKGKLRRFATILNRYSRTNLLITCYTDNSGNENDNLALSLQRSNQVKNSLITYNVSESRMYTWGLGPRKPVASNETENGRKQNRRVEFLVLYNKE